MDHRPLGRTGVSVAQLTLGAMMFGAWGNPAGAALTQAVNACRPIAPSSASASASLDPAVAV